MHESSRVAIGRYESWIEDDGTLKMQYHQFGRQTGFSMTMDPAETAKLLEWLQSQSNVIAHTPSTHEEHYYSYK